MSRLPRRRAAPLLALCLVLSAALPAAAITWEPVTPVTASGQAAAWAGSTASFTGGIALAFSEYQPTTDTYLVRVKHSTDGGGSWIGQRTRVSALNAPFATGPSLTSSGATLHIAFVEYRSDGSSRVIHRRSTGISNGAIGWTSPVAISPSGTRAGLPSIVRSGSKVVIAWTDELTGRVSVRVSTDGGVSFGTRRDIATTANQPWLDQDDDSFDAFPTVAISGGVINVGYYTSLGALKLRRSTTNGRSWTTAATLASNGNGYKPILVASGSTVVAGYAIYTGTDVYSVFRRSTDKGQSWSSAAALSGRSAAPSYQPVISVRSGTWRAAFERCLDDECLQSDVYYRESADATSWGGASRASEGPNDYQSPVGVTFADAVVITFLTYDPATGEADVVSRRGS